MNEAPNLSLGLTAGILNAGITLRCRRSAKHSRHFAGETTLRPCPRTSTLHKANVLHQLPYADVPSAVAQVKELILLDPAQKVQLINCIGLLQF